MIIAGSIMPHPAGREQARRALATFEPFMLFELERVAELWDEVRGLSGPSPSSALGAGADCGLRRMVALEQVWADRDEGGQATWRDVAARNGGFALE